MEHSDKLPLNEVSIIHPSVYGKIKLATEVMNELAYPDDE